MIPALVQAWEAAAASRGDTPPRDVQVLKAGDATYPDPAGPLVFLLFAGRARKPGAAAKVARIPEGDAGIAAEITGLELVRPRLPVELAAAIPELLATGTVNGRPYVLTTGLDGVPEAHQAWPTARLGRAAARIDAALQWNARFAQALPAPPIDAQHWLGPLDEVTRALEAGGLDAGAGTAFVARIAPAWHTMWPSAAAHGDFFPGNLLFGPAGRVAVVDWGTATLQQPLFVDPLTYEAAFTLQALQDRGRIDPDATAAVHAQGPFVSSRQKLQAAGIDAGRGTAPRLLAFAGGALRELRGPRDRRATATRWLRLLEFELGTTPAR